MTCDYADHEDVSGLWEYLSTAYGIDQSLGLSLTTAVIRATNQAHDQGWRGGYVQATGSDPEW